MGRGWRKCASSALSTSRMRPGGATQAAARAVNMPESQPSAGCRSCTQPLAQPPTDVRHQRLHSGAVLGHGVQVHVGTAPAQRLQGQLPLGQLGEQGVLLRLRRAEVERAQQKVRACTPGLLGAHLLVHPAAPPLPAMPPTPDRRDQAAPTGGRQGQTIGGRRG